MLEIANRDRFSVCFFIAISIGIHSALISCFFIANRSIDRPYALKTTSSLTVKLSNRDRIDSRRVIIFSNEHKAQAQSSVDESQSINSDASPILAVSGLPEFSAEKFLPIDSVTTGSVPLEDWNLPIEDLVSSKVHRLSIRLYVTDHGLISMVQLLEIDPVIRDLSFLQKIVDLAIKTQMKPALLDEKPVSSERTIELVLSKE